MDLTQMWKVFSFKAIVICQGSLPIAAEQGGVSSWKNTLLLSLYNFTVYYFQQLYIRM